jgi:hypothetical protein
MCQAITASLRATATVAMLLPRRLGAGLAHLGVEAEVADQLPGGREATDVTDRGQQGAGGDDVDPGESEQPTQLVRGEHQLGQRPIDRRDLAVKEVDPAQAGLEHLPLVDRQLLLGEPAPAGAAEEVGCRRASL